MAEQELSDGEVKDRIKAAFAPYRIEFEISDYGMVLKFTVCDDIRERSQSFTVLRSDLDFREPALLDQSLQQDRDELQRIGYEFN